MEDKELKEDIEKHREEYKLDDVNSEPAICNVTGVREICDLLERWGDDHLPVDDLDGDHFSDEQTMRGTTWRGKDCKDIDDAFHPGIYIYPHFL